MNPNFRPILGIAFEKLKSVKFPVIASPKIDGIRCLTIDIPDGPKSLSSAVCRSMKSVPNSYIYHAMGDALPPGLDGELVTYTNGVLDPFYGIGGIQSKIMSYEIGKVDFRYHVFDMIDLNITRGVGEDFENRIHHLKNWYELENPKQVSIVPQVTIKTLGELEEFEARCVAEGHEGICFRTADSPYKFGRSTPREQYLVKMKRFQTSEARVISVEEEYGNDNPASLNALGYAERSSHQSHMRGKNRLGALMCETPAGVQFRIGTGFSEVERINHWNNKSNIIGRIAQYKHQPHGAAEKPRIPVFLGFRDSNDMDKPQGLLKDNKQQKELEL